MMRHMILGVLRHHGARHGYALMKEICARTGVQVSIGNVYRELARLAREGLARSTPNPPEADPRRAPYEITAAGIAAFGAWLSTTPTKMQAPFHDEFSARAFFLGQAEPAVGRKIIERWKEELGLQGKTLERARDVAATPDRARDGFPLVLLPSFSADDSDRSPWISSSWTSSSRRTSSGRRLTANPRSPGRDVLPWRSGRVLRRSEPVPRASRSAEQGRTLRPRRSRASKAAWLQRAGGHCG